MFVDASAIVAILTRAPDADALADALETARSPITSPIAVFEAAADLCRRRHATIAEALADVQTFLAIAGVRSVSITGKEAETALDAFARYGKGSAHPAQLTPGACFAYAVARNYRTPLLATGDGFDKTDVSPAATSR